MNLSQSGPWIGFTGIAVLLWLYVFSGLFAPWWVVLGLLAVWVLLLVLAIGWTRPRPRAVAVLPFVRLAPWLGVVLLENGRSGWA